MALATQCPHCHTTFRVAHDQLKLRAGLVRCGSCKQIFNGIENLLRLDQQPELSGAAVVSAPGTPAKPAPGTPPVEPAPPSPAAPAVPQAPVQPSAARQETEPEDPLLRMTLLDFGYHDDTPPIRSEAGTQPLPQDADRDALQEGEPAQEDETGSEHDVEAEPVAATGAPDDSPPASDADTIAGTVDSTATTAGDAAGDTPAATTDMPDPLDQAIAELQRKPLRGERRRAAGADPHAEGGGEEDAEDIDQFDDEPSFVREGRRRQRYARATRIAMATASFLLLLALVGQAAYVWRDQLAARYPELEPLLAAACDYLDCQVGLPTQIEAVAIESSELQTVAPDSDILALSVLLRNHAGVTQAWPHIELTLNDGGEKPLLRRVFAPAEYLSSRVAVRTGLAARSEHLVRLHFELDALKASGYRVYLFYP